MNPTDFVHLHVHSHFSLGEAVAGAERLARSAAAQGHKALALTDSQSLGGMVRFVRACRAQSLRPIIGCEFAIRPEKTDVRPPAPSEGAESIPRVPGSEWGRMIFLAQSEVGYRQLVRMVAQAHANGLQEGEGQGPAAGGGERIPGRGTAAYPHLRLKEVGELAKDLMVLTGGREGELWRRVEHGDAAGAQAWLRRLVELLGEKNLAVELALREANESDRAVCRMLVDLARSSGLVYVAANDVRYVAPGEQLVLDFLRGGEIEGRMSIGQWLARHAEYGNELTSPEEMAHRFEEFPEALEATREVAERCRFELPTSKRRFPMHNFERGLDAESFLWDAVFQRATQRYGEMASGIKDRLNREFDDIRRSDLSHALVFLCRLNQELDRMGVLRGPGSGPLASSLIASVLGLTRFDPLRYGLEYQPPRKADDPFPVFRLDVTTRDRSSVLKGVRSIYSGALICRAGRWERWKQGSLLDALAAWTGLPAGRVPRIIESEEWRRARAHEDGHSESHAPEASVRLRSPEMYAYMTRRLEGAPRALTAVPGQYVLCVENLTNVVSSVSVGDGVSVSQLDSEDLDHLSLARLEIAHPPQLDILDMAVGWIRQQENPGFLPDRVPAEDVKTYQLLAEGWTMGIKPLEGPTAKSLLRSRKPANVGELAELLVDLQVMNGAGRNGTGVDAGQLLTTALLSHACAWVKAHYPVAFYAATLTHGYPRRRRFRSIWREARQRGLTLLPPDVNLSGWDFSYEARNTIRCGLMVIGGLGRRGFDELAHARRGLEFCDLTDLARRTDARRLRAGQIENLIRGGSCDRLGVSRAAMLRQLPMVLGVARPRETRQAGREPLMFFDRPTQEWISEMTGDAENEKPRHDSLAEKLALEQQSTGFAISTDPLDLFADLVNRMEALLPSQLTSRLDGKTIRLAGYIDGVERGGPLVRGDIIAVFDLSGCLVLVPQTLKTALMAQSLASGPVVVSGVLEREAFEWRIKAQAMQSLETIWETASATERLVIDLINAERGTLKAVLKTLRRYPGQVPVQVIDSGSESRRLVAQITQTKVLPCPPLQDELERILGRERLSSRLREEAGLLSATGCAG